MITNPIFAYGKVVDINDPLKIGRVKVRIFGIHDDETQIPDSELPWSHTLQDSTNPAMNGIGRSPTGIKVGSITLGVFNNGNDLQQYVVLGTYHGTGDTPSEALDEYPNNHVTKYESGHLFEIDESSGNERIHVKHKSGSEHQYNPDGSYIQTTKDHTENVANKSVKASGNGVYEHAGTLDLKSGSLFRFTAADLAFATPSGSGDVEMNASNVNVNIKKAIIKDITAINVIQGWIQNAQFATNASHLGGAPAQSVFDDIDQATSIASQPFNLFAQNAEPTTVLSEEGDIWVDTSDEHNYVQKIFKQGNWEVDSNPSIKVNITDISEFGGGLKTVNTNQKPNPFPKENDLWIPTSTSELLKWSGIAWIPAVGATMVLASSDTKSVAGRDSAQLVSTADLGAEQSTVALDSFDQSINSINNNVTTYYTDVQPEPPAQQPQDGDYWIDISDNDKVYIRQSGSWVMSTSKIGAILKGLNFLNQGKTKTYYGPNDPSLDPNITLVDGDVWFDDVSNIQAVWDEANSQWIEVQSSGDTITGGTITNASFISNTATGGETINILNAITTLEWIGNDGAGNNSKLLTIGNTPVEPVLIVGDQTGTATKPPLKVHGVASIDHITSDSISTDILTATKTDGSIAIDCNGKLDISNLVTGQNALEVNGKTSLRDTSATSLPLLVQGVTDLRHSGNTALKVSGKTELTHTAGDALEVNGPAVFNNNPIKFPEFTPTTLPTASSWTGAYISVDEGANVYSLAYSNGTNWIRVFDGTQI